jgi:hypothetical protein
MDIQCPRAVFPYTYVQYVGLQPMRKPQSSGCCCRLQTLERLAFVSERKSLYVGSVIGLEYVPHYAPSIQIG